MTEAATLPSVSVVVAFFDEEPYLATAIDTVLRQSVVDWELLLVDDGSRDGSAAIADAAAASDPRVRVLRHPGGVNAGLPASRNLGLAAARARYLCYLDADDAWVPEKLARQMAMMVANPSAAIVCGASWRQPIDPGVPARLAVVSRRAPRLLRRGQFPRLMVRGVVRTPPPSDVMYRTHALRQAGGVPAGPNMHEDQRTFIAVTLRSRAMVSAEALTIYTVRSDSVYGSQLSDPMQQVRQHAVFEAWVTAYGLRQGPFGLALVATLLLHRFRRGLTRRIKLVFGR
ncbi:MAG: glycosyltransferase family 2 protein [Acidimicrobiales bacterium]